MSLNSCHPQCVDVTVRLWIALTIRRTVALKMYKIRQTPRLFPTLERHYITLAAFCQDKRAGATAEPALWEGSLACGGCRRVSGHSSRAEGAGGGVNPAWPHSCFKAGEGI